MKFRPQRSALENARRILPREARRFFETGDAVSQGASGPGEVHRFRIQSKRFRYALEFFTPCYGRALRGYLELLKELQATLGALNDCHSSRRLLAGVLSAGDPPRRHKRLFAALLRREEQLLSEFRREWSAKFDRPALRARWERYLAFPPRRRASRRAGS